MNFPEKISDEDMQLRFKEWALAGVEVAKSDTGNTIVVFCLDHKKIHCEWVYHKDAMLGWIKEGGIMERWIGMLACSNTRECRFGQVIGYRCQQLNWRV